MTEPLLIVDARLPDGTRVDVSIANGRIEAIGPDLQVENDVAREHGHGALL
jgi:dihydroorotase-like cyclic amidohydrolase